VEGIGGQLGEYFLEFLFLNQMSRLAGNFVGKHKRVKFPARAWDLASHVRLPISSRLRHLQVLSHANYVISDK
jgi:hypothetical protein